MGKFSTEPPVSILFKSVNVPFGDIISDRYPLFFVMERLDSVDQFSQLHRRHFRSKTETRFD